MSNMENNSSPVSDKPAGSAVNKAPWLLRWFLRLSIVFLIFLVLLAGACFVIVKYYQDDVKEYVVTELNKQLNTQVIIEGKDIDFTVMKSFPYASLNFRNIKALDAGEMKHKDTLFKAGEISIQFNLIDIFKRDYKVKKVEISDVALRVRIDKQGKDNYHFWKESSDTSATAFSFALEAIQFKNIALDYKNSKTRQSFNCTISKGKLSGAFSTDVYDLNANTEMYINYIKSDSVNYLRKKNVYSEFTLNVDNKTNSYKVESGKLKIEDLLFEIYGNVINERDPLVNIGIKGKDMDIKSVLSLIPSKYKGKINDYESSGEFYFSALIQGSIAEKSVPVITANFGIRSADIEQVKNNISLKHVTLKGHYTNGDPQKKIVSSLDLRSFSANINSGSISGELNISNLDHPSYSGKINANTTLEEVQNFVRIDTIESIKGAVKVNASFSCDAAKGGDETFENVTTSGDLEIRDANIKLKNNKLDFNDINGEFKFDNNDIAVNSLKGKISDSDFEIKGSFRNVIGFILKDDQDITVEALLNSDKINLNELLENKQENSNSKEKYKLKFSEHINFNLNAAIGKIIFRKFEATDVKGIVKLKDKKLILDPVVLSTMGGRISTSGLIDGSDSTKLLVTCFSDITKIDIRTLFIEFENFGQSTITDKNLKGIASAKIQFASVLSPELQMDMDKLYAGIDMNIDNGELNNVESMKSLSRFISLKELENIRFATLKNQIEIKKQTINIPKMEIKSNALNIIFSGIHTFDNDINYKIKLSLNELLSKKAKAAKRENDEFGEVADDGLGRTNIFLSMTGNISNPVIKYDSKGAIQNVKQDLKVEKQNLKGILKEEFGLFKKDSTLNNKSDVKKEDQAKFRINWDEADKKEEKKTLKPPKKKEEDDY